MKERKWRGKYRREEKEAFHTALLQIAALEEETKS